MCPKVCLIREVNSKKSGVPTWVQIVAYELDLLARCAYPYPSMIVRTAKTFHALVALVLLACAACPFFEMVLHFNGSIFQTGRDTETSLIVLFLLLELGFAIARTLLVLVSRVLGKLGLVDFYLGLSTLPAANFSIVPPEISPPLSLRI